MTETVRTTDTKNAIRKRKNYLPTLIAVIIFWSLTFGLIYFVDPDTYGAIYVFFVLMLLSLLFTFSIIFTNTRRGFIISLVLILFLVLRIFGVGNILNFLLLTGVALSAEVYFLKRK